MLRQGLLGRLIEDLCVMPGIGPKSAQRIAFHLLQRNRTGARKLADTLLQACDEIAYCEQCRTLTEHRVCGLCSDAGRDSSLICIVESPADIWAVEQSSAFNGLYFVLHGHLSPLDGIGPDEIGLPILTQKLASSAVDEIILATNSTVEGEATAHLIADLARKYQVRASRIAHGVPMGGELEYIDGGTLSHAFNGRRQL